jgi:Protein of unknown function (DUF3048) N-terminal domain/Protein of unknown function (DUF3048) C-terminal domain
MRGRRLTLLAGLVVGSLVAGACSGNDEEPAATPTTIPAPPPTRCPLTGEDPPKRVNLTRPAVAIKVENSPQARPQSGLEDADVVFEEIVEGGITRFLVLFHCHDSKQVGPVRSARFDDPKIAKLFTRVLAFSGANSIVLRELAKQKMISVEELTSNESLYRVPPGTFDIHNLFGDTTRLRKLDRTKKADGPTGGFFEFGGVPKRARKARSVTVHFSASNTIEYRWRKGAWRRYEAGSPFTTKRGGQIAVPNVLIQEVRVDRSTRIVDSAGNPSPDIDWFGGGRAFLFRNGKVIKGSWRTKKNGAAVVFRTGRGDPFVFDKGATWIELVPSRKGQVKGSVSFK